jgi:hypothetical protein
LTTLYTINNLVALDYGAVDIVNIYPKVSSKLRADDVDLKEIGISDQLIVEMAEKVDSIIIAWGRIGEKSKAIEKRQNQVLGRGNLATTSNKHIEKLKKDMADEAKRVRDEKVKKDEALKKAAVVETNSERSRQTAAANAKYQNDVKKAEEARLTSDVRELVVVSREGNDILRSILAVLGGKNPERQVPNTIKEQVVKTEPSKPFYDRGAPVTNYVSMGKTVYS